MNWIDGDVQRLAQLSHWGYHAGGPAATEPTALAALALLSYGHTEAAERALAWLVRVQAAAGCLGPMANVARPCWPTSLATIAWRWADRELGGDRYRGRAERALQWSLWAKGNVQPRNEQMGHDPTLVGWPWVLGTHSWLEPTAMQVVALRVSGQAQHERGREALRLIVDRQLGTGGWNYGNTSVLGQTLRPHVQPTGWALLAIPAGHADVDASIEYLVRRMQRRVAIVSLCLGLMGLAAHDRLPALWPQWLKRARADISDRQHYARALLALAALGPRGALVDSFGEQT